MVFTAYSNPTSAESIFYILCHDWSMYSSINGHLDYVYVLQFENRIFNNIYVQMHTYFHFSWVMSGDGMTTLCGIGLCLLFEKIGDQFFRVIILFDIPFTRIWVPCPLVSLSVFSFYSSSETRAHHVAQASLRLMDWILP